MNEKKIVVDTKLSMTDYISLVNAIALEYFDENGNYHPYIGELNAMRLFWNNCIKESKLDNEDRSHHLASIVDIEDIVIDEEFITAYNEAITNCSRAEMTFGYAYNSAMEMVNYRKSSFVGIVEALQKLMTGFIDKLGSVSTDKNIETLNKIAKELANGTDINTIIMQYGKELAMNN